MNPLSTSRNDYYNNKKNSSIMTPLKVSNFIFKLIEQYIYVLKKYNNNIPLTNFKILDPCCGKGNLLKPYCKSFPLFFECFGLDIKKYNFVCDFTFKEQNFLDWNNSENVKPNLIICNPPFNNENEINSKWMKENKKGKGLLPEIFADKIFELFGVEQPLVLFTPMGMRLNQRKKSSRWRKMRDKYPEITSIISLPLDIFPNVEFHNEILIFNIQELKPHYFLPEKYL